MLKTCKSSKIFALTIDFEVDIIFYSFSIINHILQAAIIFSSNKPLFVSIIFSRKKNSSPIVFEKEEKRRKNCMRWYAKLDKTMTISDDRKDEELELRFPSHPGNSFVRLKRPAINPLIEATTIRWKFRLNREYLKANNGSRTHMCGQAWLDSSQPEPK